MTPISKSLATEPDMEQLTGSELGKEDDKAGCYHCAYLTSMQSKSYEMPGLVNQKLESKLLGEISTTSDVQMIYHP